MATSTKQRVRDLLQEAINLLQEERAPEPTKLHAVPDEEDTVITGKIGRPAYKELKGIPFFQAGLGVRKIDGKLEWLSIEAWRNAAIWADTNINRGSDITVVGRWKTNTWTDDAGELKERHVFVVSEFRSGDEPF